MKKTLLIQNTVNLRILMCTTFLWALNSFGQIEYYSTNGKNRLTKVELENQKQELKQKFGKISKQEIFVDIKIKNTETKKDSIIQTISFDIHDGKSRGGGNKGYLAKLIGEKFPDFELKTLLGEKFSASQLNGKPTMINFWFTKCAPCIDEMPVLNTIYDQYKNDINFVAITYESKETVSAFLKKYPFKFKHLVDAQSFTDSLELKAYPLNLFLDANGVLQYIENGIAYVMKEGEEGMKMGDGKDILAILEKLKQ
ncbi:TlpA disulfide reductase family protein [Cellulophaga sp. Hel_I_12]|uniref:TlpA family protein disulfide reductase n=1 Tax=Cellulophaga sp. Hel_I_12 TaxID=1249972 RepID=UPI00064628E6|nr:TlpA disulfide reductase family protein [Cellulophaga sp. Hel_I_12]